MRALCILLGSLFLVTPAGASSSVDVIRPARSPFPAPAQAVEPGGPRLELVSSRYHSPADLPPPRALPPPSAPKRFRGTELQLGIRQQPGRLFLVYGGRYLLTATSQRPAFDFVSFLRPPNGAWLEELTWAREADGVLYVEHTHLTYASATRGRNAYISAIDAGTGTLRWRSRALVANARTFVVAGDLIVSGYGFTAEPDFLYLLDRRSGRVLHRLPVPSAPEVIELRGNRLYVRTYDRDVIARIVR